MTYRPHLIAFLLCAAACDRQSVMRHETVHKEVVVEDANQVQDANVRSAREPDPKGSSLVEKAGTAIKLATPASPNHKLPPPQHNH